MPKDYGGWKSNPRYKSKLQKKNERKMQSSFFKQQYDARGIDFVNFMNARDIKNSSYKIFKDLANGLIDFDKHLKSFQDPIFVDNLKLAAQEKLRYHEASYIGLCQYIDNTLRMYGVCDQFYYAAMEDHRKSSEAYLLLVQAFENIQLNIQNPIAIAGTIQLLISLLSKYKYNL